MLALYLICSFLLQIKPMELNDCEFVICSIWCQLIVCISRTRSCGICLTSLSRRPMISGAAVISNLGHSRHQSIISRFQDGTNAVSALKTTPDLGFAVYVDKQINGVGARGLACTLALA